MAGRAIFGDPKQLSEFRTRTGVDLTKEDKKLLVVVRTPQSIEGESPSLDLDLIDAVSRKLKVHGVQIVNPDEVAKWIDIKVYNNGQLTGQATYDSTKGGANMGKFIKGETKIAELVDQLFPGSPQVVSPKEPS